MTRAGLGVGVAGAGRVATTVPGPPGSTAGRPFWREILAPYERPRIPRSLLDLATSAVPYLALLVLMYLALDVSRLLTTRSYATTGNVVLEVVDDQGLAGGRFALDASPDGATCVETRSSVKRFAATSAMTCR